MSRFIIILKLYLLLLIISTVAFAGCGEKEEKIPISEVPEVVLTAAQKAVEGIEIKEAEIENTSKGIIYDLEGTVDGKTYEIEVSADGKVIEVEPEDGEDENNDEADTDDDEDEDDNLLK